MLVCLKKQMSLSLDICKAAAIFRSRKCHTVFLCWNNHSETSVFEKYIYQGNRSDLRFACTALCKRGHGSVGQALTWTMKSSPQPLLGHSEQAALLLRIGIWRRDSHPAWDQRGPVALLTQIVMGVLHEKYSAASKYISTHQCDIKSRYFKLSVPAFKKQTDLGKYSSWFFFFSPVPNHWLLLMDHISRSTLTAAANYSITERKTIRKILA